MKAQQKVAAGLEAKTAKSSCHGKMGESRKRRRGAKGSSNTCGARATWRRIGEQSVKIIKEARVGKRRSGRRKTYAQILE